MINPLRQIEINSFVLRHPTLDEGFRGFRIAHISDIHMGTWVKPRHIEQIVEYVNQADVDLVALTGDYVCYSKKDIHPAIASLKGLNMPSFAVLGNHDHWTSAEQTHQAFEQAEIEVLTNENRTFARQNAHIDIVGVDDHVTEHADVDQAFRTIRGRRFCLTLNHVPDIAPQCIEQGAHLVLSGHTHGFQFNIPRFTHRVAQSFGTRYFAGAYRIDDSFLYISRGLGSASWPVRIRAKPELTFFTLEPDAAPHLEWVDTTSFRVQHRIKQIET